MLGVLLALAPRVAAQLPAAPGTPAAPTAPAPIVDEIVIQIIGPQQISREAIMAHVLQPEKAPYSQELVDRSLKSLTDTGQFEYIRTDRETMPDGGVRVIFRIEPRPRVSAVVFKGDKAYTESRLSEEIKTTAGAIADPSQLKHDVDALIAFYQKKGYSQVKVSYSTDVNETAGTAVVTFDINEGPEVVIRSISFVGNDHISSGTLRDQMKTERYIWLYSWIAGTGHFQKEQFEDDLDALRKYYKSKGYLDVDIPEDQVAFDYPNPGSLDITIHVHEGRQYHIGKNITISGNTIFPTNVLMALLTIKPGDVFSPDEVDKNANLIRDYYGKAGYLDTFVRVDRKTDESNDIGLDFVIMRQVGQRAAEGESEKFYVEGIDIQGNTKTKSTVIVRELTLSPGDVFDTDRMKVSEDRLKNTGYFDQVNLTPEETNIPGKRNLRITVKEARTFTASVGAGFTGVEGFIAYLEFTEINFDLFSPQTYFRGGGQQARVRLTIGNEVAGAEINYVYPWLFERRLDVGIDLSHTETSYYSSTFFEEDDVASVFLRKPIIEYIDGTLRYTIKNTQLRNVDSSAPPPVQAEQGYTSASKVSLDLVRTKDMDDPLSPTRGEREEIVNEVAGGPLGGQTNIYRVEAHANVWIPTFETQRQVISFSARVGSVMGYGGKGVPYSERYFLGGQYDLRGYAYRWVGPRFVSPGSPANGQPIGGKTMAYFTTEYSFDIISPLRLAIFHDIGFVNYNSWDLSPNGYRQDVGIGIRFFLGRAPIRLDLGFPLNPDSFQSHSFQFNFAFSAAY